MKLYTNFVPLIDLITQGIGLLYVLYQIVSHINRLGLAAQENVFLAR